MHSENKRLQADLAAITSSDDGSFYVSTHKRISTNKTKETQTEDKFAGAQLMEDNPDIADLSDPNRPTKLGEKCSQLYDNEYTEAFEVLDKVYKKTEIEIVEILLGILTTAYELCTEYSQTQVEEITLLLQYPGSIKKKECRAGESTELTNAIQKVSLSTLRKETSELPFNHIKKLLWQRLQTHTNLKRELAREKSHVSVFAEKCAELCWLMSVQSPPLFLDIAAGQRGSRFNKNAFREYTASGRLVAFVLWPPLYITEKGALLAKGIAQGK